MRILVYGLNYAPELIGTGRYTGAMARWLAGRGHEVRVVTAPPYYPAWKRGRGYGPFSYVCEADGPVRVYRCPLYVPGRRGGLNRILHLLSFALTSLAVVLWQGLIFRPHVVVVVAPTLFCAPGGLVAAALSRLRGGVGAAWLHIQDFEVEAAFGLGLLKGGSFKRFALAGEKILMTSFQMVSTITDAMRQRLYDKGVTEEHAFLFPNWADTKGVRPLTGEDLARARARKKDLGLSGNTVIALYSGNLGEKQGLEVLLEVARRLGGGAGGQAPPIAILLCGDGAAAERLKNLSKGTPGLFLLPVEPRETFNDLLNLADIHLLPQRSDAADLVMPSKLGAMLASGRPVVAGARQGTALEQAVEGCGFVVPPDDPAAMAAAILDLAGDAGKRERLGKSARNAALKNWDREKILSRIETAMLALAGHEG